ncbi:Retrovirus-related Pol polyprotein from transposon TNT 1-94 [Anthophora quadrimaculata]
MGSLVRIEGLNKENYDTWKIQMRALLVKNDAWCYVSGEAKAPIVTANDPTSEALFRTWAGNDEKAKSDIILSINPSELKQVKDCKTSNEVWQKLEQIYQSRGPARKATLLKKLILQRMNEGEDVREHLRRFFDAVDKLHEMDIDINADLMAILLLYSLPQSFENFRCAIESRDELPPPDTLRIKIIEENDARKNEMRDTVPNAMIARKHVKFNHGRKNDKAAEHHSGDRSRVKCFRCRKIGHIASECRTGSRNSKYSAKSASSDVSFYSTSEIGQSCEETRSTIETSDGQWCLDSGSTSHMCKNLNCFESVDTRRRGKLNLATNTSTDIHASGTVRAVIEQNDSKTNLTIKDALHVPDLRCNLLSIGKITDRGYKVIFTKHQAKIIDEKGNEKLIAVRRDGLYYVEQKDSSPHAMATDGDTTKSRDDNVVDIWHRRLGHLNQRDLLEAKRRCNIPNGSVEDFKRILRCEICIENKMTRSPFPEKSKRATNILDIIHSDVCGPMRTRSYGGNKYFVTFIDDHSRWCEIRFLKSKDQLFDAFRDFKNYIENQTGRKIKVFQSDNGKEYVNSRFDRFLKDNGIKRRLSVAYNPQQNGVAERKNRTIVETARCLIAQSGLPRSFWAEAVSTANYIRNRCPSRVLAGKSPYERLYGRVPKIDHFREFGCDVYFLINNPNKGKFEPRSRRGVFVGYPECSKGYRVWNRDQRRVEIVRDVKFLENYSANQNISRDHPAEESFSENIPREDADSDEHEDERNTFEVDLFSRGCQNESAGNENVGNESDTGESSDDTAELNANENGQDDVQYRRGRGRPRKIVTGTRGRPRKQYNMVQVGNTATEEVFMAEIPLARAVAGPDADEWHQAIAVELGSILKNDTWKIVERPKNAKVIGSRIVLRNKYKPDGKIDRRKARIVARGFSQRYGIDFNETFAPVARLESVRIMAALAAEYDLKIHQIDVTSAYLNGKLDEEIFMEVPRHVERALDMLAETEKGDKAIRAKAIEMRRSLKNGDKVCSMRKALYGLKQAGRSWHHRLDEELRAYGLLPSTADPCVYYQGRGEDILMVLVYVDDILIASRDLDKINKFKGYIGNAFDIRDLEEVKCCLGIEFNRSKHSIQLHQRCYIKDLLERFSMTDCKPASTPLDLSKSVQKKPEGADDDDKNLPYRELVGSLMYLAIATRPDIAHAVSILSRFNDCFSRTHWTQAKRVLRYLKGTAGVGLTYKASGAPTKGYADADWGNCTEDRKSFTGYCFVLASAAVSWASKRQKTVALSSVEAEYMSMSEATKEAIYLRRFLQTLGFELQSKIQMYCDNQGAIKLAENPVFHNRTKHIDVRHHFVRDALRDEAIRLIYIPTGDMVADLFTKGLPGPRHRDLSERLGLDFRVKIEP